MGGWSGGGPAYAVPGGFGVGAGAAVRYYLEGTVDPSAGAGIAAPIGSLYARDNAGVGETWHKTGAAATAWAIVGGGGGGFHGATATCSSNGAIVVGIGSHVPFDGMLVDTDAFGGALPLLTIGAGMAGRYRVTSTLLVASNGGITEFEAWLWRKVGGIGPYIVLDTDDEYSDTARANENSFHLDSGIYPLGVGDTLGVDIVNDTGGVGGTFNAGPQNLNNKLSLQFLG